jgi:hypothetical protein
MLDRTSKCNCNINVNEQTVTAMEEIVQNLILCKDNRNYDFLCKEKAIPKKNRY